MKYVTTTAFLADYRRLSARERDMFLSAVSVVNVAYAARETQSLSHWPASLRIRSVEGVPGVYEMTWSFSGPDGRATFEIISIGGEPAIKWRRVGNHKIFREP